MINVNKNNPSNIANICFKDIFSTSYNKAQFAFSGDPTQEALLNVLKGGGAFFVAYVTLILVNGAISITGSGVIIKAIGFFVSMFIKLINNIMATCFAWFFVPFVIYCLICIFAKKQTTRFLFSIIIFIVYIYSIPSFNMPNINIKSLIDAPINIVSWFGSIFIWFSQILLFTRMSLPNVFPLLISALFSCLLLILISTFCGIASIVPVLGDFTSNALQMTLSSASIFYIFVFMNFIGLFLKGVAELIALRIEKKWVLLSLFPLKLGLVETGLCNQKEKSGYEVRGVGESYGEANRNGIAEQDLKEKIISEEADNKDLEIKETYNNVYVGSSETEDKKISENNCDKCNEENKKKSCVLQIEEDIKANRLDEAMEALNKYRNILINNEKANEIELIINNKIKKEAFRYICYCVGLALLLGSILWIMWINKG